MKRKVIQLAEKTLVVSLPVSWTSRFNVCKGDEVDVEEEGGCLVVSSGNAVSGGCVGVDVSEAGLMVKRVLGSLYKTGYDEVTVNFGTSGEMKTIKEVVVEEFPGFDITSETERSIVLKETSKVNEAEFDTMMRRIFLIILSMAEDSLDGIRSKDGDKLRDVVLRDKEVNRCDDFCRRIINKRGHVRFRRCAPVYFIVEQLEKVADIYKNISRYVADSGVVLSDGTLRVYGKVSAFFRQFYELYYAFDVDKMVAFGRRNCELVDEINRLFLAADRGELVVLFYLYSVVEDTFNMNGPLMAALL